MKFIASVLLTALLSIAACLYLPWWSIAPAAFMSSIIIPQQPGKALLSGFIALLLVWGGLAWYISNRNEHIMAHKISLLIFQTDNPLLLVAATALIGGLVAGLASLSASYLRR
ncbi:MAG TPA: hypothetical protein PKC39_05895 [Ferruginibacter sp.]|nr:hypothetical protein [Ferruginibacter sp.]HMP20474.1 hypothetical protein [Ferruginibacter sp.]